LSADDIGNLADAGILTLGSFSPSRTRTGLRRWLSANLAIGPDRRREQRVGAGLGPTGSLEVVSEAHVEHLVSLVEDDRVHVVERKGAPVEMIHGAARRATTTPRRG
jgi:hypothetical protein